MAEQKLVDPKPKEPKKVEETEETPKPLTSLTPRNKDRRLKMVFPDAAWGDPEFDPKELPEVFDYQFVNRNGIEISVPGTDEFNAQRTLNKFLDSPEVVAVESDNAPGAEDEAAAEVSTTPNTKSGTESSKVSTAKASQSTSSKETASFA